jgi:TolB-like protein
MKRKITLIFIGLLAINFICQAEQLTVAVSTFEARSGLTAADADAITDLFISALVVDGAVKVVDRTSFDTIIAEMKFQASDWTDSERVAELGKMLKATSIIRGSAMVLAGQAAITATILDLNTAQMVSSATLRMSNIGEVFDKMPAFVKDMMKFIVPAKEYKIGDTGPGGGIIFFVESGHYMELSGELGSSNWDEAITAAKNFRGGGLTDWRLPTLRELGLMYTNLKQKNLGEFANSNYWSSSSGSINNPGMWFQNFNSGNKDTNYKSATYRVRAVRDFNH